MEKRELICIGCPLGCMISVELEGKEVKNSDRKYLPKRKGVCGERSNESYADCDKQCAGKRGDKVSVSVKTKSDIPKGKIF